MEQAQGCLPRPGLSAVTQHVYAGAGAGAGTGANMNAMSVIQSSSWSWASLSDVAALSELRRVLHAEDSRDGNFPLSVFHAELSESFHSPHSHPCEGMNLLEGRFRKDASNDESAYEAELLV